jgi:hypothetical protein
MIHVAGLTFRADCLVAINISSYEQGKEDRIVSIVLAGPWEEFFTDERADEAYIWYLQFTGQARIQTPALVSPFTKPT